MKRLALLVFLVAASTASGSQQEYRLLEGLSGIAQRIVDMGITIPLGESGHPTGLVPLVPEPTALPRGGYKG